MSGRSISEPQADLFNSGPYIKENNNDIEKATTVIREKSSHTAVSIDGLIRLTELSPIVIQTVLLDLELAGEITRH